MQKEQFKRHPKRGKITKDDAPQRKESREKNAALFLIEGDVNRIPYAGGGKSSKKGKPETKERGGKRRFAV